MLLISQASDEETSEEELWRRFYSSFSLPEGFTVLDPFLGGGTTLIEAAKQGADCIGCDIDPVACFITKQELTRTDPEAVRRRFREIEEEVAPRIRRLYRSSVGGKAVDAVYFFWVDRVTCPDCGEEHDGHPTYQLAHEKRKDWQAIVCPHCDTIAELRFGARRLDCKNCRTRTTLSDTPVTFGKYQCPACESRTPLYELYRAGKARPRLFAQEYLGDGEERGFAPVTAADLRLYETARAAQGLRTTDRPYSSLRVDFVKGQHLRFSRNNSVHGGESCPQLPPPHTAGRLSCPFAITSGQ